MSLEAAAATIYSNTNAISHPYGFRIGTYQVQAPVISANQPLVFGLVQEKQIVKRQLTINNIGNNDLQVLGVTVEGEHPDWFTHNAGNAILPPGGTYIFQVICQPFGGGAFNTHLAVKSTDPNQTNYNIELGGEARSTGTPTPTPKDVPTPTATLTPTPEPTQEPLTPSLVYEFNQPSLDQNHWGIIPGGFTNAPAGAIEPIPFTNEPVPSSKDQKGLAITVQPGQVAFAYGLTPIPTSGNPLLLRIYLRASSPNAIVTLAALKNGLLQADGSIAANALNSTASYVNTEGCLVLLYEPDEAAAVTPVIQVAASGKTDATTVWIDRMEVNLLDAQQKYPGSAFFTARKGSATAISPMVFEFDKATLADNGWEIIPGGFTNAPAGTIKIDALPQDWMPNSKDQRGLSLTVQPGQVAFTFAKTPVTANGNPVLLRLSVRSDSPDVSIALAVLKNDIYTTDGSIATLIPKSSTRYMDNTARMTLLFQTDQGDNVTPVIQAAATGKDKPVTVWVDKLEVIPLQGKTMYEGTEFFGKSTVLSVPASITVPIANLDPSAKPFQMVYIRPGTFWMGSPESEKGRSSDESLPQAVTLSKGFYLGRFEVIQAQWAALMGIDNKDIALDLANKRNNPVLNVTWFEAVKFCNLLSTSQNLTPVYDENTGAANMQANGFRLPTEAEWEYACRAGSASRFYWGNDLDESLTITYTRCSSKEEQGVGYPRLPNAFGLWDTNGNAMEWCQSWFALPDASQHTESPLLDPAGPASGTLRTVKGGGFNDAVNDCRSASRKGIDPNTRKPSMGFRVLRLVE